MSDEDLREVIEERSNEESQPCTLSELVEGK
jgi:hypothetical protein